jgi:tetratricopeptide (TPR) repeat protein
MAKPDMAAVDRALRDGMALHQQGRLADARARYRSVLEWHPNQPDALHLLGLIEHQSQRPENAARLISQAIQEKPDVAMFHLNLAGVMEALGRADEATEYYRRGLALDPAPFWAYMNLGRLLLGRRRHDDAAQVFRQALERRPDEPDALNGLGIALLGRGQAAWAIDPLERAVALRPNFAMAQHNLAIALADVGRLPDSARAAEQAVAAEPKLAAAHWHLGLWHYDCGRRPEALAAFDRAAEANPRLALARAYAGVVLAEIGERDRAERRYAEAVEIDPSMESLVESARYAEGQGAQSATTPARFGFKASLLRYALEQAPETGLVLEFGVFTGRSINIIAEATEANIHGFDSFEGLPEAWIEGEGAGSYDSGGALPQVRPNVQLHVGQFDQSLPPFVREHPGPARFVHIDCDLYSSTRTVLDGLDGRLVPGTVLVFDEYFAYPGWREHEYKAFQELVDRTGRPYEYLAFGVFTRQAAVRLL